MLLELFRGVGNLILSFLNAMMIHSICYKMEINIASKRMPKCQLTNVKTNA
jgi:hypothetical protein